MKNHRKLIVGFVLVFFVVVFSVMNTDAVQVSFGFTKVQSPLIFIILGSTVLGALIVLITWYSTFWLQRKEVKQLKKQVDEFETNMTEIVDEKVAEKLAIEKASIADELEEKTQRIEELEQQFRELSGEMFIESDEEE